MGKKILIAMSETDYDPTEVAIPWNILSKAGHDISFCTPTGHNKGADPIMLTGKKLGPLKNTLAANDLALHAYKELNRDTKFHKPLKYNKVDPDHYDALILPGGHAKGIKPYLESKSLQKIICHFFDAEKTIGAICHGVVLLARSKNAKTGKPYIYDYQVTSLLRTQELAAWSMTCLWMGNYYRTYPWLTVQAEVEKSLKSASQFKPGPFPLTRDSLSNLEAGFVCEDKNLLTARWPGDAHAFALAIDKNLNKES